MTFAPGAAPVLADAFIYALLVIVGHGMMRMIAGASRADGFARSTENAAKPMEPLETSYR
jgi:hypothetical protein